MLFQGKGMQFYILDFLKRMNCIETLAIALNFKGYLRYKMITSQNVPSEAQIKNFFIL